MASSSPSPNSHFITLQWKTIGASAWQTCGIQSLPVTRPVAIRIEALDVESTGAVDALVDEIQKFVHKAGGTTHPEGGQALIEPAEEESLMEVIVCQGAREPTVDLRVLNALERSRTDHVWVLPVMPRGGDPTKLPDKLQKQNIAFWDGDIRPLALTVLGRAGVTSLDRRVFISYRRVETEPMAGQLFEALTRRNFSVFLDTVSVDAGVDFQDRLMEQLADKSMIVLLLSQSFSTSKWTMAEVDYARKHGLSLLVYRLPHVGDDDPLLKACRSSDLRELTESVNVQDMATPSEAGRKPELAVWRLKDDKTVQEMVAEITAVHDGEMIARLAQMRQSTLAALARHRVPCSASTFGAAVRVTLGGEKWSLFPTARPPGVPELHDASCCKHDHDDDTRRAVVGNVSSFSPVRTSQMDWVVDGRNVSYMDVHNLDIWIAQKISQPTLSTTVKFQWPPPHERLKGRNVFISASVPTLDRDKGYLSGPLDDLSMMRLIDRRLDDAVKSLVAQVLGAGGHVVHGGHPKVMPFIADQACNWLPAAGKEPPVATYQSKTFQKMPASPGREEMVRAGVAKTVWVDTDYQSVAGRHSFPPSFMRLLETLLPMQHPNEALCGPLLALRIQMLMESQPLACVCLGGMEGIEAEAELFLAFAKARLIPAAPVVHVLRSTFGAAQKLRKGDDMRIVDAEVDNAEHPDYGGIMARLLGSLV